MKIFLATHFRRTDLNEDVCLFATLCSNAAKVLRWADMRNVLIKNFLMHSHRTQIFISIGQ